MRRQIGLSSSGQGAIRNRCGRELKVALLRDLRIEMIALKIKPVQWEKSRTSLARNSVSLPTMRHRRLINARWFEQSPGGETGRGAKHHFLITRYHVPPFLRAQIMELNCKTTRCGPVWLSAFRLYEHERCWLAQTRDPTYARCQRALQDVR